MSSFQVLMPFARSNSSNRIVGIDQVERDDDCNCHCLSCGTPVTARLGSIRFSSQNNFLVSSISVIS